MHFLLKKQFEFIVLNLSKLELPGIFSFKESFIILKRKDKIEKI